MKGKRRRWRVGSEWLEVSSCVDPYWFEPERECNTSTDYKRALALAAYKLKELMPEPTSTPIRVTAEDLRERSGLGDGYVDPLGEGGGGLGFALLVQGQEFVLDQGAMRVLQDEIDALNDQVRSAIRLARVQASVIGLDDPYDGMGGSWDHRLLEALDRMYEEFDDLHQQVGLDANQGVASWLRTLAQSGLRSANGMHVLLDVQRRGRVNPEDMDGLCLNEADQLARVWARVMLEYLFRESPPETGGRRDVSGG